MTALTVIACLELAVIAGLCWALNRKDIQHAELLADFSKAAERERLQLINHIKRPEFVTPPESGRQPRATTPHPGLAKIGTWAPREKGDD
jgi:hypothetical protein